MRNQAGFRAEVFTDPRIVFPVDTNDRLRERVRKLLALGVNHKVLAAKMGMPTSTFSKWINQRTAYTVPVSAWDGLKAFEAEIAQLLETEKETQRESGAPPSTAGGLQRTGTGYAGTERRHHDIDAGARRRASDT